MPSGPGLYEIQLGVYATARDVTAIVAGCERTLAGRVPWQLSVVEDGQGARPGGMPLAEFYEELPQQWSAEHPGADPGPRSIHEIRVGVLATRGEVEDLREELTRVLCPDPEHASPCPVPWSTGCTDAGDDGNRVRLDEEYGALRRG